MNRSSLVSIVRPNKIRKAASQAASTGLVRARSRALVDSVVVTTGSGRQLQIEHGDELGLEQVGERLQGVVYRPHLLGVLGQRAFERRVECVDRQLGSVERRQHARTQVARAYRIEPIVEAEAAE